MRVKIILVLSFMFSFAGAQLIVPGNTMDIPQAFSSKDKPHLEFTLLGSAELKEHGLSEIYSGLYPGFGAYLGAYYKAFKAGLAITQKRGVEISFIHTPLFTDKYNLAWGIDGLIIPDIESEGTENIVEDSASLFERIPLFAQVGVTPVKYLAFTGGIGLGKYATETSPVRMKLPGLYMSVEVQPLEKLKLFWEGFYPSQKRNLGISYSPLDGIEIAMGVKYADYTPEKFTADHAIFAIRVSRPLEALFGPKYIIVTGRVYNVETGEPITSGIVSSQEDAFKPIPVSMDGSFLLKLKPGYYTFIVNAGKKYEKLVKLIEIPEGKEKLALAIKIKYSREYKTYLNHIEKAKKLLEKEYFDLALREVGNAIKIFPDEVEAQDLKDRIVETKNRKIAELKAKATISERNKDYEEALKYYKAVLKIDPTDREAKEGVDRVNILILEAKKKAELEKEKRLRKKKPVRRAKPDISKLLSRGKRLFFEGKYKEAKSVFLQVLRVDPANREAKFYLDKINTYLRALEK